jgi:hypothetical protein
LSRSHSSGSSAHPRRCQTPRATASPCGSHDAPARRPPEMARPRRRCCSCSWRLHGGRETIAPLSHPYRTFTVFALSPSPRYSSPLFLQGEWCKKCTSSILISILQIGLGLTTDLKVTTGAFVVNPMASNAQSTACALALADTSEVEDDTLFGITSTVRLVYNSSPTKLTSASILSASMGKSRPWAKGTWE